MRRASGLPQTSLDGGHRSSGLRLVDRRFWSDNIQIVSGFEVQLFSSEVQDSPLAREDFSVEAELAIIYHF